MENKVKCKKLYKKSTCREKPTNEEVDDKYESMSSLIAWNISKVLKSNPNIDLKAEITATQKRLESKLWDVNSVTSDYPDQRYLACALLAWQQMGHGDANSLYQFIQFNLNNVYVNNSETLINEVNPSSNHDMSFPPNKEHRDYDYLSGDEWLDSSVRPNTVPIMKLPVETKIVMRCDMCKPKSPGKTPPKIQNTEPKRKEDTACCIKSACKQRLVEMDASTSELKKRLQQLAKREEERQRLLIRAETAWRDLEKSYIRRLKLAGEKEEDITKQMKNSIEERNNYKSVCGALAKQLEERGAVVQKEGQDLKKIEGEVCEKARKKFKITEDMACAESCLAQNQCRSTQIERDLRFREEQIRRKVQSLEDSAESFRGLRCEAERALRTELGALKDQVAKVSKRLLLEESVTANIKNELDDLRVNKSNILEDLDACKIMCDHHMQDQITELKHKTEELADIKEKLLECRCKLPQDSCVEVKRTPSLAAICRCSSENEIQDSCSCTSLRSSLLSNLLKDLFGGLQSELGDNGSVMPCQLLKCLEDKHNWDRSTPVKTNLRSFFSKLLVGELDIAIASSIEKYHVKWVGSSCVDETSRIPNNADVDEWQEQALENRAQKLAKQLAEQLFQEKADQLIEKAKGIIAKTPPPCQCGNQTPSTYPCLVNPQMNDLHVHKSAEKKSAPLEKKIVTNAMHVQVQVAEQKTKSLKRSSIKPIRDRNNTKIQKSYGLDYNISADTKKGKKGLGINQKVNHRAVSTDKNENLINLFVNTSKKNKTENNSSGEYTKKNSKNQSKYTGRCFNRPTQSYAVNLCLCEPQRDQNAETPLNKKAIDPQEIILQNEECKQQDVSSLPFSNLVKHTPGVVLENFAEGSIQKPNENLKKSFDLPCSSKCLCLNKAPSNTSLNKLLDIFLHGESNNLDDKEIMNRLQIADKKNAKLNQEMFTNTESESKSYKCQSTHVDALQFHNYDEYTTNLWDLPRNQTKELKDEKFKTNSKEVEANLYDSDYIAKLTSLPNKRVINNNNNHSFNYENDRLFLKEESLTSDQCNIPTRGQNLLVQSNQKSINLIANYIVDNSKTPLDSNCKVDFLGVTLNNKGSISSKQLQKNVALNPLCSVSYCQCTKNTSEIKFENVKSKKDKYEGFDDSYSLKHLSYKNKLTDKKSNCICCSTFDENQDLEMNTFELLTEYLHKKLEELKLPTSKSCCLLPYEEDLLYSDILKKVKKIISEMNDELACKCSMNNKNFDIDASWKRACSLLQEYLQIKVKKIKCTCSITMKNSNVILPDMLEKVCKLIENDFERLKMTYVKKEIARREKDWVVNENSCVENIARTELLQRGTRNKTSTIMTPSCDTPNKENVFSVNDEPSVFLKVHEPFKNVVKFEEKNEQTVLSTLQTGSVNNLFYYDNTPNKENKENKFTVSFNNILDEKVFMSIFPEENQIIETSNKENHNRKLSVPYIGYTLDCPCDKMLGPCVCARSTLKDSKNKSDNIWNVKPNKKLSYIMQSVIEGKSTDNKISDLIDLQNMREENINCDKIIDTRFNEDEINLKISNHNVDSAAHTFTNTSHIYIYDDVDYLSYDDWDDCESSNCPNSKEATSNKEKLFDSLLLPMDDVSSQGRDKNLSDSDDVLTENRPPNCNCDMVPICHVKMLIDNIGRQLENSKCTCDSLTPNVCPVHLEM